MISSIIIVELFQSKSRTWDGKDLDPDQELVSQCILQLQDYEACGWMSQLPLQGGVGSWKPLWWEGGHQSLSKDITRLFPDAPKVMVIEEKHHLAQNSANLRMETNQGVWRGSPIPAYGHR